MFERVTFVLSPMSLNFRPLKELLHGQAAGKMERQADKRVGRNKREALR